MTPTDATTRQALRLAATETLWLPLAPGACLHVSHGAVDVHEAPIWLAERMLPVTRRLVAGQVHAVRHRGWLRLDARAATQIELRQPASEISVAQALLQILAFDGLAAFVGRVRARCAAAREHGDGVARFARRHADDDLVLHDEPPPGRG